MLEKQITSDRGKTSYWIQKNSLPETETLVFLPGLSANHHLFDEQIAYFSDRHTVLVWDAPAHGQSRPYKDFSYANLAEELKTILDAEGLSSVILIGQSAGGFVSQSFIARYGKQVKGFVSIGSCPYGTGYYSKSDLFWLKQTKWMLSLFPDNLLRWTIIRMCNKTAKGRNNMRMQLADYKKTELCSLLYQGFAGFIPEIHDLQIPCPVCLIVGKYDKTGKVMVYNKAWHKQEAYPLHIIKNAAHNANADQPELVNSLIEAFIRFL